MLAEYLSKEPAPEERQEYALAQLAAIQVNMNRGKGKPPHKIPEFMLFADAWKDEEAEKPLSFEAVAASMGAMKKRP